MTSAGPEPQWLLDPDDDQLERYWNGAGWTDYRRVIRSRVDTSSPVESPLSDDPSRVPWVASASFAEPVADVTATGRVGPVPAVGDDATVVAGGYRLGQVGAVVDVSDDGCLLRFSDDPLRQGYRFFPFADVQTIVVATPELAAPPSYERPPGWRNVSPGYERWWDGTNFVGPVRRFRQRSDGPRWLRRRSGGGR